MDTQQLEAERIDEEISIGASACAQLEVGSNVMNHGPKKDAQDKKKAGAKSIADTADEENEEVHQGNDANDRFESETGNEKGGKDDSNDDADKASPTMLNGDDKSENSDMEISEDDDTEKSSPTMLNGDDKDENSDMEISDDDDD
jgi:hypothetical protein